MTESVARWLNVRETALRLRVSQSSVLGMCRDGRLPGAERVERNDRSAWIIPADSVPLPPPRRQAIADRNHALRRRRLDGASLVDLVGEFRLSESRVRQIVEGLRGEPSARDQHILSLKEEGVKPREIARRVGLSESRVLQILRRAPPEHGE